MKALDFEYDGLFLSDFGFMICNFGDKGLETISNGSTISFNTVPIFNGRKNLLTHSTYDECMQTTFSICKNPCNTDNGDVKPITAKEERQIMRWLNRRTFHKFKIKQSGYEDIYFNGSFNIDRHMIDGELYGFELSFTSDTPFAYHEPIIFNFSITENEKTYLINDISDEIGFIYANVKITCNSDGDLIIRNSIEDREIEIKGCTNGEVITLNNPIITTTLPTHKIQNDFNFNFVRIANEYNNIENILTFSIPCDVELVYEPIQKVGV